MKLLEETKLAWLRFFLNKKNTTEVESFDDYALANKLMREWMTH